MKTKWWLVAAGLCGVSLLGRGGMVVATPTTAAAKSAADAGSMEQRIVAKEREGLDALKSGNLELFGSLTAEDAVLVDTQGPASKAQVMKNVAGFQLTDYTMDDVKFVAISDKSGLISYKIMEKGVSHGKEFVAQVYVSSVWAERDAKWLCLFSQETAARRAAPAAN